MSWRVVLASILARVEAADDRQIGEDVFQLQGLCERMDSEAFLPVMPEELTTHVYGRVVEFSTIVDDITDTLVDRRLASTKGMRDYAVDPDRTEREHSRRARRRT